MKRSIFKILIALVLLFGPLVQAQNLPVGTPVLEEYYRNLQLLGKLDSNISFTIRPLTSLALQQENIYNPDTSLLKDSTGLGSQSFHAKRVGLQLLPLSLQTQYNSRNPYGWNDGPMIPARGFQTLLRGGVFAKYGVLSIQLMPELVFAENKAFTEIEPAKLSPRFPYYDLPQRFGIKPYFNFFPGQSSIRLNLNRISFGLSSENLSWGPGIYNSLLMSNNAPGFYHLTVNTRRPISTPIGSFEGQLIAGRLDGSGYQAKPDDWRYLSGMALTYQPKWVPGLFLGLTRSFQMYSKEVGSSISNYFPLLQAFEKQKTNEDAVNRDQLTSAFIRWLWVPAKVEVYFEYGRNDHSGNIRDFTLQPEHSRAHTLGLKKVIGVPSGSFINLNYEMTQMQQPSSAFIRNAGSWYGHNGVVHGYTHGGQVLGAGIGPGANSQTLEISAFNGLELYGLIMERYVHDTYAEITNGSKAWVDYSLELRSSKTFKNVILGARLKAIGSSNYQWRLKNPVAGSSEASGYDMFNLQAQIGCTYRF